MGEVSLNEINKNLILLIKEMKIIKEIVEESCLDVSDEVVEEVENSRKRSKDKFVSHEEMKKEFD